MNFKPANLPHTAGAFLALFAFAAQHLAGADDPGTSGADFSGALVDVSGDMGAFQKRHQVHADGFGGVESYMFERTYGDGTLSIDGRAMLGNNDYNIVLKYVQGDEYVIEAGYREFRTWYDPTGTVIASVIGNPGGLAATTLYDDEDLAIDRRRFWIDGRFVVTPNFDLHISYTHTERNGEKDSTSQADTTLSGGLGTRSVVPSIYEIDESQDLYLVEGTLHGEKAEFIGAVLWDIRKIDDTRLEHRRPGEAADRYLTHAEMNDSDLFNAHAFARYEYSERVALNASYSHTRVDTVVGGSRIYGSSFFADWNPAYPGRQNHDEGFYDLSGSTSTDMNVANVNVTYIPVQTFTVVPSFRVYRESRDADTEYVETSIGSSLSASIEDLNVVSDRHWDEWAFDIESRYTGVKNWVFIGRAQWTHGDGELAEDQLEDGHSLINRDSEINKWTEKYGAMVNWYPTTKVNFSFIYSYWDRYTDYDTLSTSKDQTVASGDRYPAFVKSLTLTTNDFAARMTLRPASNITLVSRFDVTQTDLNGSEIGLPVIESGTYDSQIFSQSVNWNPRSNVFIQGTVNYTDETLHTPAVDVGGSGAGVVHEQDNGNWSASATVGFIVDEQDSLFFNYDYFFANDFVDNSSAGAPYGLNRKDYVIGATWTRNLGERLSMSFRYAFAKNREDSSLGLNDYEANLFYGRLAYHF